MNRIARPLMTTRASVMFVGGAGAPLDTFAPMCGRGDRLSLHASTSIDRRWGNAPGISRRLWNMKRGSYEGRRFNLPELDYSKQAHKAGPSAGVTVVDLAAMLPDYYSRTWLECRGPNQPPEKLAELGIVHALEFRHDLSEDELAQRPVFAKTTSKHNDDSIRHTLYGQANLSLSAADRRQPMPLLTIRQFGNTDDLRSHSICDEPAHSRMALPYWLSGRDSDREQTYTSATMITYQEVPQVDARIGVRVADIDTSRKDGHTC